MPTGDFRWIITLCLSRPGQPNTAGWIRVEIDSTGPDPIRLKGPGSTKTAVTTAPVTAAAMTTPTTVTTPARHRTNWRRSRAEQKSEGHSCCENLLHSLTCPVGSSLRRLVAVGFGSVTQPAGGVIRPKLDMSGRPKVDKLLRVGVRHDESNVPKVGAAIFLCLARAIGVKRPSDFTAEPTQRPGSITPLLKMPLM